MPEDRLILVSDVHVDEWPADLPNAYQQKRQRLLDFLDWVAESSGAQRFLINGDLLDVPQQDRQAILPRYLDLAGKFRKIVASGIKFGYVIGNHDSGLVGLDIALDDPPVRVDYPYLKVQSGARTLIVEHGHLQDPWLWDYVRQLAAQMLVNSPGPNHPNFLRLASPTASPGMPTLADTQLQLNGLWQARAEDLDPGSAEAHALVAALRKDLTENYGDVLDPQKDRTMMEKRAGLLQLLSTGGADAWGMTPTFALNTSDIGQRFEELVQAYYSGPHWRQVAQSRAAEVSQTLAKPVTGVILGHTHWPDEFKWTRDGQECHYVNSGSWRHDSADIVVVENGEMTLYRRRWDQEWPKLA